MSGFQSLTSRTNGVLQRLPPGFPPEANIDSRFALGYGIQSVLNCELSPTFILGDVSAS